MPRILDQGPAFWLPPDFLDDDDDDNRHGDFLLPIPIPIPARNTLLHHHYHYSVFPPKLPNYSSTHHHDPPLQDLTYYYFPPSPLSKHSQKPLMVPISPQTAPAGPISLKSTRVSPNGFLFPYPPPPQSPACAYSPRNPLASLYTDNFNNYDPLKQEIPICGRRTSRDVDYCSPQNLMSQNRQGNRVFAGSPHSAWPALQSQLRPNTPPLRDGSSLHGSHQVMRKCAGTGVFFPRRYGIPVSDSLKKPGLLSPPDQVPVRKKPVSFENPFTQNEDAEAMAASGGRKMHEQQQEGESNELCLPHEWAY